MTKIGDIVGYLEQLAPPAYQESYDNSQLLTGQSDQEVKNVLVTLDCTEPVVDEAINKNCNLIVAHHPIIFKGLKKLTGSNYVERTIIKAIKNDIAILAMHTNLDNVITGVNRRIADQLGLQHCKIMHPKSGLQKKLVVFVPEENTGNLLEALYQAGAGNIGNYSGCSFRVTGTGTFEPNEEANPHIGSQNQKEEVTENRVEVIFPGPLQKKVLNAMYKAHPYEEVAYYLHNLENPEAGIGSGIVGELPESMNSKAFLKYLKEKMELSMIRYTEFASEEVKKVALCGGAGSFLIKSALAHKADVFITSDFKYHEFFDAEGRIALADIGHFESERFTKELIYDLLSKNFTNFAVHLADTNTNPVRYYF